MGRVTRWLALLAAPLLLTSCLLVPTKFASTLDIRADRSFTFTYVGEVQLLKTSKPDAASDDPEADEEEGDGAEEASEAKMWQIAAPAKPDAGAKQDQDFSDLADTGDEAAQLKRLAETLSNEYGFRSVRYLGNRKLAVDYRISGKLDHAFVFPFNPDGEILVPFLAIELRGKDRVRVKAPGFANDSSTASGIGGMGGMGGMPGGSDPGALLDGSFTLTTNAEIVSQNQENGAQASADGGKKLVWAVNPNTRDAPMAVLRVNALP